MDLMEIPLISQDDMHLKRLYKNYTYLYSHYFLKSFFFCPQLFTHYMLNFLFFNEPSKIDPLILAIKEFFEAFLPTQRGTSLPDKANAFFCSIVKYVFVLLMIFYLYSQINTFTLSTIFKTTGILKIIGIIHVDIATNIDIVND